MSILNRAWRLFVWLLLKCYIDIYLYKWWILHHIWALIGLGITRYYGVSLSKDRPSPQYRGQTWWDGHSFGVDTLSSLEHVRYIFARDAAEIMWRFRNEID